MRWRGARCGGRGSVAGVCVLRELEDGLGDIRGAFRAFRFVPMGLETLYPLAGLLPPVNRFFLDPALRSDAALQAPFMQPSPHDKVGVMHFAADADGDGERGGFWLYVPEHYSPDRTWPLGADVTYREIEDLSHTYPREMNAAMLAWLSGER